MSPVILRGIPTRQATRNGPDAFRAALLAATTVLALSSFRVLFPLAYNFGERRSFAIAGLLALGLFALPVLASPGRLVLGRAAALVGSVVLAGVARLVVQLVGDPPLWLAGGSTVCCLVALALVVMEVRDRPGSLVVGLVAGMALDTAILAAFRSWDPSWQEGAVPLAVAVVLGSIAVALSVAVARGGGAREPAGGVWGTAALGPFLMLHVLFLQNAAFIGAAADTRLPVGAAIVLGGDLLALAAVAWGSGVMASPWGRLGVGASLVLLAAALGPAEGAAAAALFAVAHPVAALALVAALGTRARGGPWRVGAGVAIASVSFLLLTLAFYLHYDSPLPFPNVALAPIAAALAAVAGLRGRLGPRAGMSGWVVALPLVVMAVPLATLRAPAPASASAGGVRVVCYNVHTTVDVRGRLDPLEVARVLEAQRPDVVILQEVSRGWAIAGGIDTAEWLSHRLGLPFLYVSAADDGFGNAILSRFPVLRTDEGLLPKGAGPMDRSWIRVALDVGDGWTLTVLGTHLHHRHEGPEDIRTRLAQIEALLVAWDGAPRTIIAGDMNAAPDSEEIARFESAGLRAAGDLSLPTYPSTGPRDRIDYLFATPDLVFSEEVVPRSTASDHLAVAATVDAAPG